MAMWRFKDNATAKILKLIKKYNNEIIDGIQQYVVLLFLFGGGLVTLLMSIL